MRNCASPSAGRDLRGRVPAIALGALLISLLAAGSGTPALAERLDLGLQPFSEAEFDQAVVEAASADQPATEQAAVADSETNQQAPEGADTAQADAEPDAAEPADGDTTEGAEIASDADSPEGEPAEEADAPDADAVAEADLPADDVDSVDTPDLDTAAFGDLPEPQPPQLLWRFKTLFALKDEADGQDGQMDTIEELEEHLSHMPLIRTARVERHIRYFQTSKRDHFDQWLARLNHYRPLVEKIFAQFELPTDLIFLSLVESGFNPKAYSRARAAGPWQFMKATGRIYGLRVDDYVDERRDPIKSTVAAARYLRDLYDLFGTWPLAMAAYNAGERKIQRALRKAKAESFWEIAQTRFIRRETREYVPRFMAAAIIAKNPDQYGFEPIAPDVHQFEEIVVSRPLSLRAIAAAADIPYTELHRLNPELRRDVTPPHDPAYHLKVPVGTSGTVEPVLVTLKTWTPPVVVARAKKASHGRPGLYRVRMGDSLSTIARRFRVTIEDLKTRNNLAGRSIKVGDLLLVGR
jgi:membrane-bound lytic murein transglycosylase D